MEGATIYEVGRVQQLEAGNVKLFLYRRCAHCAAE